MRRRPVLAAIGVAALALAAADTVICQLLQRALAANYRRWASGIASQGFTLRDSVIQSAGYPWGARLVIPGFALEGGRAVVPGGLAWHTERLTLSLPLFSPFHVALAADGAQLLRIADSPDISFYAERLAASVPLNSGTADGIDVAARGVDARWLWRGIPQDLRIAALRIGLTGERGGAARTTARLSISASQVVLPDNGRFPLGGTLTHCAAELSLASPALSGESSFDQARAWHDWGGLLTLESFALRWGPLSMAAAAELSLDDQLQPAGSGTARLTGGDATLDALTRGGLMSQGVAQTAKAVLATMPRETGGALVLPFTLQDSTLMVARTPLLHLDTVTWGRHAAH